MTAKKGRVKRDPVIRLGWLLPVTFALHIAEEYLAGFPAWFSRITGARLSTERFFELSGLAWVAMAAAVAIAAAWRPARVLLMVVATMVLTNGLLHAGASAVTAGYSPGTITGVLLWIPLGAAILVKLDPELPAPLGVTGIAVGVGLQAMVVLAALRR